jgi:WD40 repeat protein
MTSQPSDTAVTPDAECMINVTRLTAAWSTELSEYVTTMALHPAGHTLAVGTADGQVYLLNSQTGAITHPLTVMPQSVLQVAWSADGQWLAASGQDTVISYWAVADMTRHQYQVDRGWVQHLAWHPTRPTLLLGAQQQAHVLDVTTHCVTYNTPTLPHAIMGLSWHPNLPSQFALVSGSSLYRFDQTKPAPLRQFTWGALLFGLSWSPNGQVMATGTHDQGLHIWYPKSGDDLHMSGYTHRIKTLAWDSHSRFLATGGGQDVTVWDFSGKGPAGSTPVVLSAHSRNISQLAYQPNGALLSSGDEAGQVFVWQPPLTMDWDPMTPPLRAYPCDGAISTLLYSPLGGLLVGTANGHCLYLTNMPSL